jgi:hypothetical protein
LNWRTLIPQLPLIDRGFGLIYDTERNITWLQDVNYAKTVGRSRDGQLTWPQAMQWVASLSLRGIRGWRLPTALNPDGSGPTLGHNCVGSEMGHLYLYRYLPKLSGRRWASEWHALLHLLDFN